MQRKHNPKNVDAARELRRNMTPEERHLWYDFLRGYHPRFSRQKILGRYIADFYSAEANLVVELDGSGHYTPEGKAYDAERTEYLAAYGLQVVRISNEEIHHNFRGVCEMLDRVAKHRCAQKPKREDR